VAGNNVRFKDRLSAETDVSIADNSVIKALFSDAGSAAAATGTGTYVLRIDYNENRGSIEPDDEFSVTAGVPVNVTANLNKGYFFGYWRTKKGNAIISNPYMATTAISLTGGDATVEAVFLSRPLRTLELRFKDYEGRTKTISSKYW
jgi:hypothetical protein